MYTIYNYKYILFADSGIKTFPRNHLPFYSLNDNSRHEHNTILYAKMKTRIFIVNSWLKDGPLNEMTKFIHIQFKCNHLLWALCGFLALYM